jgi:hypothetical protein
VALLERRPALPWLRDLVDGDLDVGRDGVGTSAFALNRHLRQSPGVNPPLLPYLDWGAPLPPPTMLLFSAIAGELNSLLRNANVALTIGTWTKSPACDHFRMLPRLVRVVNLIIGFNLFMSHVVMTSAADGPGSAQ